MSGTHEPLLRPPVENGVDTTRLTRETVMTANLFLNLIVIDWTRWLGAESHKSAQAAFELRVKLIIDCARKSCENRSIGKSHEVIDTYE